MTFSKGCRGSKAQWGLKANWKNWVWPQLLFIATCSKELSLKSCHLHDGTVGKGVLVLSKRVKCFPVGQSHGKERSREDGSQQREPHDASLLVSKHTSLQRVPLGAGYKDCVNAKISVYIWQFYSYYLTCLFWLALRNQLGIGHTLLSPKPVTGII